MLCRGVSEKERHTPKGKEKCKDLNKLYKGKFGPSQTKALLEKIETCCGDVECHTLLNNVYKVQSAPAISVAGERPSDDKNPQ